MSDRSAADAGARRRAPALAALWHSMQRAYRAEPKLVVVTMALSLLTTLPDALFAYWLSLGAEGITRHEGSLVTGALVGLGVSAVAGWALRTIGGRMQRKFRMRVAVALESHVAGLLATVPTIEHQERPEHLDKLSVLRESVFHLDHMYSSLFSTLGALVRLFVTVGLLASVNGWLALLALFALPTVAVSSRRSRRQRAVEEAAAPDQRRARHLFDLTTTAAAGREVRLYGNADELARRRRESFDAWQAPLRRAQWVTAAWQSLAWAVFGGAFVAAVVTTASVLHAAPSAVVLVLAAGGRLAQYVSTTAGEADFLRMWLDAAVRLDWLEQYAADLARTADPVPVPARLVEGIRFDHVSFCYPGTDRDVLDDVSLTLPAGRVVAVVGENGAGKSTLVKLIARLYDPTGGKVLVDGVDLRSMHIGDWRERLAGAFQDFYRFELAARTSVGVGDLPRAGDAGAVATALQRGGAGDLVAGLPGGADTQLGVTWPDGVELSQGQWQKIALARGFMRDAPLVLALDEPTAALDPESEHALFESFAAQARAGRGAGGVTVLVSHRFSTVRMADLIVVLDGARVVEVGSHEELVRAGGHYAELFGIQARAYAAAPDPSDPAG